MREGEGPVRTVCRFVCVSVCSQARAASGVRGVGACQMETAGPTERLAIVWPSAASL